MAPLASQSRVRRRPARGLLAGLLLLAAAAASAAPIRVAVLDFELNDLTLDPQPLAEQTRTASLRPLLESALRHHGVQLAPVEGAEQQAADRGFGYLFEHAPAAAQLAAPSGAHYVVVGRLHKPSFLFAYLKAHLIDVRSGRLIGDYVVEVKGGDPALSERGVRALAEDIMGTLAAAAAAVGVGAAWR